MKMGVGNASVAIYLFAYANGLDFLNIITQWGEYGQEYYLDLMTLMVPLHVPEVINLCRWPIRISACFIINKSTKNKSQVLFQWILFHDWSK